ncbi:MAG: hypothetical protein ACQESJ_10755, partial [Bacteroidota bacterium]
WAAAQELLFPRNHDNLVYIFLGAWDEWSYFLKKYVFNMANINKELNSSHGQEFYNDDQNELLFSYYPIFKRGQGP